MKAEYINPFVDATIFVLEQVLELEEKDINRGKLSMTESPIPVQGVASIIGLVGDLKGRVIFDMSKDTAVAIASTMNFEQLPGMNSLVRSTINELSNMIAGQAVSRMLKVVDNFDITPPSLFSGTNIELDDASGVKTLVIPLELPQGRFVVNVAMKEA